MTTFTAGQNLTAAQLERLVPLVAFKTVDETVNNSSVLQNDDEIFIPVAANAKYDMELLFLYISNGTPDIKFQWTYPALTTIVWAQFGLNGTFNGSYFTETLGGGLDGTGANNPALIKGFVSVGANPGTLQLQWAQITANASNTTVRAGTYLKLIRIG